MDLAGPRAPNPLCVSQGPADGLGGVRGGGQDVWSDHWKRWDFLLAELGESGRGGGFGGWGAWGSRRHPVMLTGKLQFVGPAQERSGLDLAK